MYFLIQKYVEFTEKTYSMYYSNLRQGVNFFLLNKTTQNLVESFFKYLVNKINK